MEYFMPDILLTSAGYGGYISIFKFVIFAGMFFVLLPLVGWVHKDAEKVKTDKDFWTGIVLGTAATSLIIWLVVPVFIIGMLFYLIVTGAAAIGYAMHRDSKVMGFDRILTIEHIKGLFVNEAKKLEQLEDFAFITANNNEVPVPQPQTPEFFGYRIAYDILTDAAWRRTTDVVFSPTQQNYNVTYWVDGSGVKQPEIPRDQMEYFIRFIKGLADLDTDEKRKPQKGKFTVHKDKKNTDWQVSTAGSTAGEQIHLTRLTRSEVERLSDLGLPSDSYEQLNKIPQARQGLFIISGTKKSGITSTFYALLRNHDAFINSVNTVEKQPSTELLNITQNVFALSDTGTTTFAKKVQAVIRMGVDVVGVADCTDAETAQITSVAAKDRKIVYVTLEAENVVKTLGKWIKLVGDRNLAAETLMGISNQRLVRMLCDECKQAYEPNKEILHKFNIPAEKAKVLYRAGKVLYDKHGKPSTCENCQGTGFIGRTGIFETIMINDELKKNIKQSKSLSEIATQFRRAKMLYLQEQALKKVVAGTTSINEMVRVLSTSQKKKRPEQK
jgi:type II secretory ATPase GspE/PulE/Tfp pilus assembly ATPase PilB-like protein